MISEPEFTQPDLIFLRCSGDPSCLSCFHDVLPHTSFTVFTSAHQQIAQTYFAQKTRICIRRKSGRTLGQHRPSVVDAGPLLSKRLSLLATRTTSITCEAARCTVLENQKTVSAYFTSKQIQHFAYAEQSGPGVGLSGPPDEFNYSKPECEGIEPFILMIGCAPRLALQRVKTARWRCFQPWRATRGSDNVD